MGNCEMIVDGGTFGGYYLHIGGTAKLKFISGGTYYGDETGDLFEFRIGGNATFEMTGGSVGLGSICTISGGVSSIQGDRKSVV